ncbi:putative vacuolar h+-atpase assembly protein [Golovinomyces cichoracearum]|uniref:Putative vacuolar h+-atpase assembly protein n=1 Tax=Golovinomyces cichoracearum TaxID=62708 RepID=A0A420J508_9PEZI|nr:putative vacuolar h+-atpase assembly protein [Golovinomyces cichoracearum]
MVLLTMTATIVEALLELQLSQNDNQISLNADSSAVEKDESPLQRLIHKKKTRCQEAHIIKDEQDDMSTKTENLNNPKLTQPEVGNPITHLQILDLSKLMKCRARGSYSLENMLRGSKIFIPPPSPRPEKTLEYKSLMTRLRREEEARLYKKMTKPASVRVSPQNFSTASAAHAFSNNHLSVSDEIDDVTYSDIKRQVTLIFNVLISILACGAAIWMVARGRSTQTRLALSLGGSILVGVAEVTVYSGYIRRINEAKIKENKKREVKEVIKTWMIGADDNVNPSIDTKNPVCSGSKEITQNTTVRRRK